jgi:hypothetical protein
VLEYAFGAGRDPREVVEESLAGPHDCRVSSEHVLRCVARLSDEELRWFAGNYAELDRRARRRGKRA